MRRLYPVIVAAAAVAVGIWAAAVGGGASAPFLALATLALGWVAWLAWRAAQAVVRDPGAAEGAVATGRRRKELEREKQALLKALKELDFDHEMGKVSEKDFADIGAQYRARAIRVMRQLDDAGRDYEAMIEKDVAARTRQPGGDGEPATAPGKAKCPGCGTHNDDDAEFCKKCGKKLSAEAAS